MILFTSRIAYEEKSRVGPSVGLVPCLGGLQTAQPGPPGGERDLRGPELFCILLAGYPRRSFFLVVIQADFDDSSRESIPPTLCERLQVVTKSSPPMSGRFENTEALIEIESSKDLVEQDLQAAGPSADCRKKKG